MRTELVRFSCSRQNGGQTSGRTSPFGVRPAGVMIPCTQELEASYPKPRKSVKGGRGGKGNVASELDTVDRSVGGGGRPSPTEAAAGPRGRRRLTRCAHSDRPPGETLGGPATRPRLGLAGSPSPAGRGELSLDEPRLRVSDLTLAAQVSTKVCTLALAAPRPSAPRPLVRSEHFLKWPLCAPGKGGLVLRVPAGLVVFLAF